MAHLEQHIDGLIDLLVEAVLREMEMENEKPACADLAGRAEAGGGSCGQLYGSEPSAEDPRPR